MLRRILFIAIGLALFIGLFWIPIEPAPNHGNAPFRPRFGKMYRIENEFGRNWLAEIDSVTADSLFEEDALGGHSLSHIVRVTFDGRVYYLNPKTTLRKGEKMASEGKKWEGGEERWTVGAYLVLLVVDATGALH